MTTAYNNVFVVYDCTVMRLRERRGRQGKLTLSGESDLLKEQLKRSKCGAIIGSENVFSRRDQLGSATRKAVARANEWLVRSD